jgi:hypothetical protein
VGEAERAERIEEGEVNCDERIIGNRETAKTVRTMIPKPIKRTRLNDNLVEGVDDDELDDDLLKVLLEGWR